MMSIHLDTSRKSCWRNDEFWLFLAVKASKIPKRDKQHTVCMYVRYVCMYVRVSVRDEVE